MLGAAEIIILAVGRKRKQKIKERMENNKENSTVQELITPVPAALEGVQAGPQSSKSNYRNTSPVANLAGGVDNTTSSNEVGIVDPFGNSTKTIRTPPMMNNMTASVATEDTTGYNIRLKMLKIKEEKAFVELGSKLSIINSVASGARNIHRIIQDNLVCVMALYQQMREYRDAIANNPIQKAENISRQMLGAKDNQNDPPTPKTNVDNLATRAKRLPSTSPKSEQITKRAKTSDTQNAPECEKDVNESEQSTWKQVEHRKKRKKKTASGKQRGIKMTGEALTIKANESKTYAEMLKQMKDNINPSDLGVEIDEMRRTKAGELLIKFKKGEGQAEKLKGVLISTLGEEVTIRSTIKTVNIDIRDMDESTEEQEIINALMKAAGEKLATNFKVLNIRESFGKTKQALVQMPTNTASKILAERRVTIGWIKCRIRATERIIKCFKCLDQGHLARECSGTDRTGVCRRCCISGHKSKDCKETPMCILCQEAGLQEFNHFIGTRFCVTNRRNLINKHD